MTGHFSRQLESSRYGSQSVRWLSCQFVLSALYRVLFILLIFFSTPGRVFVDHFWSVFNIKWQRVFRALWKWRDTSYWILEQSGWSQSTKYNMFYGYVEIQIFYRSEKISYSPPNSPFHHSNVYNMLTYIQYQLYLGLLMYSVTGWKSKKINNFALD